MHTRVRNLLAAVSALLLLAGLAFVTVTLASPAKRPVPVQQTGTAAGRPHRVPAAATLGRMVNGRFVPDSSPAGKRVPGPVAKDLSSTREVPGAIPAAEKPRPLKLPVRGKAAPESGSVLKAPAPARKVGYDPKTSRRLRLSSANQVTYANADGTKTAFRYQYPVNYRLPDGKWMPVSTVLVPAGAGGSPAGTMASATPPASFPAGSADALFETPEAASPSATVTPVPSPSMVSSASASPSSSPSRAPGAPVPSGPAPASPSASPSPAAAAPPASGWREQSEARPESFAGYANASDLVSVPVGNGQDVSFGIAGAAPAAGAVAGGTVSYAGVRPDASADFSAGTGTVKEQIVLSSPSAPDTWVFPLDLKGLRAEMGPGGIVEFADAAGAVVAYVPHGFMSDSKIDPHSGDGATSYGVTYSLVTAGGRQAIKMTLDTAWLDSRQRVYPVTVDPSVQDEGSGSTTYVQTGDSGADNSGGPEIHAGTYDGGGSVSKSFLSFGDVASDLRDDTVLGARLGLFNTWSYSCSPRPVYVYPVTSSWSASSMSWPGPSTGAAVGRKTFATGWVPYGSTSSPCPASWEGINLDQAGTNLVNGWTHGTRADDGLAVGASASDSYAWKKFASHSSSTGNPFLAITYTTDGASYKLASRQPVTQVTPTQNGKFAVRVTNTGSSTWDANNGNGYEMSYRAYNSKGKEVADAPVFTAMPSTVAPGQSVTVDVTVDSLSPGSYALDFDMYHGSTSFSSQGIAPFAVGLYVPEPPPTVSEVYPPTGFVSSTLQQQLSTSATGTGTLTYDFTLTCEPLPGQTCTDATVDSGKLPDPYWTPPAADLDWDIPYQWQVVVTATSNGVSNSTTVGPVDIEAQVPQPAITTGLGGGSGQAYDPLSGNYTTSATDAAVKAAGPPLEIDRVYNSMDPRTSGAFGASWSTVADTSLQAEDGGSTVLVTMPSGQQMRFGQNGDGSYAAPFGSPDALVESSSGSWTLRDASGDRYAFTSSGQLTSITEVNGYAQDFTYNTAGQLTAITDAVSGRTLTLTWETLPGAAYPHVASVSTQAPSSGASPFTWTYTYSGDELTEACAPAAVGTGCTQYSYGSASHYFDSVLDANPRDYWQLGESTGANAADEVDANLGTADGTYHTVTLGAGGPLAGSGETAASFNGTSSYVSVPNNLITDSTDVSVGLWFKAATSTASGVLYSYDTDAITNSSGGSDHHEPLLYIGTNGELYAEFWNGSIDPIHTSTSVDDGNWHYAVITASSDSQSLYLDGAQVGSPLSGQIDQMNQSVDTIGAGFWNDWPSASSAAASYFDGDIAQAAVYPQPLTSAAVASQYALAEAASPELTQVTLPSGNTYESAAYDADTGRLATYTDPHGGQWTIGQPLATGYRPTSDSLGQVIDNVQVTDPAGRQETYSYDMLDGGRLAGYSNGVDPPETFGYDAAGFLTTVVDQDGSLVCLTSDVHGNVLTRSWYPVEPASLPGIGTGVSPSSCGGSTASSPDCTSSGAPCTTFYSYYYNAANPLDPQNDELLTVRDGRSASATDDTYETRYAYNTTGQLQTVTTPATSDFPNGRTTIYGYTEGTETAPDGGTEPRGLLKSQTTPGGAKTSYTYDSNGDLAQVTDPSGRYTTYAYDALGRALTSTVYTSTYPAGETTSYTWTPTGQQASVTYPAAADKATPGTSHQLEDTYSYDDDNNLLSLTQDDLVGGDPSRTTSYTYNDHDEVAAVTQPAGATTGGTSQTGGAASANPQGATTGYDYDGFGNVTQVTDPNGNQYRYSYNEYQEPAQKILYTSPQNEADSTATCTAPATQDPDGGCDLVLKSYAYDPAGLVAATTDAMGRITNYAYDGDQELIESSATQACTSSAPCTSLEPCTPAAPCTSGSVGTMTVYGYDGAGNMISQAVSATDGGAAGTTTTADYDYDAAGRLTSEVDDAAPPGAGASSGYQNRTTAYTYNADGRVLSKTTGTGDALDVTDYGYDTAGDETSQTVQDGSGSLETTWTYDQNGLPLTQTSPRGNAPGATASDYTTSYAYDPDGNLETVTGPPVPVSTFASQTATTTTPVTTYGYDTFGDQTQVRDPDGNVTTTAYDGDGRVTSTAQAAYTPPGASSSITQPTTYAYDEDGNLTSVKDPAGNTTSYTYDALSDVTSKTDPLLPGQSAPGTWQYTYDPDGEQLSATDPLHNETQQTYDYLGNVATSTDALQDTTKYAYDYLGDQTVTDTPDGVTTSATYDGLGELTSVTDGADDESKYDYDDQGNLAHAYNPDGSFAEYGYDEAGRLTSVTDYPATPPGQGAAPLRSEAFGYDADGNQTSVQDWNGNTTQYSYDAAGELASQVVPVSSSSSITTSYGYDAAGNRTSVTGGNLNTTWTTYNSWNLPESVVEPTIAAAPSTADTTWTTAYNADGQPAAVTEPGGVSLSYGYDPLGDITSETGGGASASTPDRSFTYYLDGRMETASAPGGTDTFTYYPTGDLKTATGPSGNSSYTYNDDELVSSETDTAGTTSYTYDDADRLSTETEPLTGSVMTWAYNADSDPKSISYATGGTAGPVQTFGYDSLERLKTDTLTSASGTTLASESYGYDNNGNITSESTGGLLAASSVTYGYDEANRLTSAASSGSTVPYGYDNDGNLTTDGPDSNTYNAQDQLVSSTDNSGTTGYSYSLNGDLTSVTPPSGTAQDYTFDAYGDLASAAGASYGYDALGRPVTRTDSSGTASMSYLGTGPALASDGTSEYTYDPSGNLTATGSSYGAFTTMSDVHGDVAAMFSPTSAAAGLAGYESYTPYGAGSKTDYNAEDIGFQGDYTDPATGLVDMGARWYNPATGGFVSSDTLNGTPVPSTVDGNPYAYADGNPLTETDPTGHDGGPGDWFDFDYYFEGDDPYTDEPYEYLNGSADWDEKEAHDDELYNEQQEQIEQEEADAAEEDDQAEHEAENEQHESEIEREIAAEDAGKGDGYGDGGGGYGGAGEGGSADGGSVPQHPAPPPPPQDGYTSGEKAVPEAPKQLLKDPYISADPTVTKDETSFQKISDSKQIVEHAETSAKAPQGTTEPVTQEIEQAGASDSTSGGDTNLPSDPLAADGKPATPSAENPSPNSGTGNTGANSAPSPARFTVNSNGTVTDNAAEVGATAAGNEITTYYPPNDGFFGEPTSQTLEAGTRIDRYGGEGGRFVSPEGTSEAMRALPPGATARPYNLYEVVNPIEVRAGTIAPAFGQLGLGTQYVLPDSVGNLIENGYLKLAEDGG